jgi:hypothetical protein
MDLVLRGELIRSETYKVFQKELYNFESLCEFIQRTCTEFWNCHNIANHTWDFIWDSCASKWLPLVMLVFPKELYNGVPNVTAWLVLRKRLHLKLYKLSVVEGVEWWIVCTTLSINVFVTLTSIIWNTITKLFLKQPVWMADTTSVTLQYLHSTCCHNYRVQRWWSIQ